MELLDFVSFAQLHGAFDSWHQKWQVNRYDGDEGRFIKKKSFPKCVSWSRHNLLYIPNASLSTTIMKKRKKEITLVKYRPQDDRRHWPQRSKGQAQRLPTLLYTGLADRGRHLEEGEWGSRSRSGAAFRASSWAPGMPGSSWSPSYESHHRIFEQFLYQVLTSQE